jgi:hypothetical protein
MNRICRLVWSQVNQAWVAIAENAKGARQIDFGAQAGGRCRGADRRVVVDVTCLCRSGRRQRLGVAKRRERLSGASSSFSNTLLFFAKRRDRRSSREEICLHTVAVKK